MNWAIYYGGEKYKKSVISGHIRRGYLDIYSMDGLWNAVETYNASYPFYSYAKKCIDWSLYNGIRRMQPFPEESFYKRIKKSYRPSTTILFDEKMETEKKEDDENKKEDEEFIKNLWIHIATLEPFVARIFHYKYDFDFNVIRSNKEVAELMCFCEEHIRKIIEEEKNNIGSLGLDCYGFASTILLPDYALLRPS
jgi:hypothetical protein